MVAIVLAVLALPAALFPWLGLIISVVVLAIALVALIVAVRSPRLQTLQDCSSNDADEVRACMENRGED
ncbi:MAG: hypothetical protein L0K33_04900 [Corynebacterium sp.]|nr:hypothetical protein [Corynebacterium sp.]MDN6404266.1 hypothetical protein [Corynebacterium sp.]